MSHSSKRKLSVHRCRFVDFTPSAISALAFPPLPLPKTRNGRVADAGTGEGSSASSLSRRKFGTLAVGRANGNIELYEWSGAEHQVKSSQTWTLWKILFGPNPSKVDSLAFSIRNPYLLKTNEVPSVKDLRLFSSGGGSELVEWDLQRGTVLRTVSSQGGAIWSIAVNPASSTLAIGCEDGRVRLLSIENDELSHVRKFDRAKCRVMSIAWGPPSPPRIKQSKPKAAADEPEAEESDDDDDDEWTDAWLVAGGSDSSIRKWDVKTGRVMDRMTTDKLRKQATLVWTVAVLSDGTIISGDSMGDVTFWDGMTCTQISSFRAHGADVLCLAVSPDGESIFSSGVDQKTSHFSLVRLSSSSQPTRSRWVHSLSKRMHAHDVRALAVWPPYSPLVLSNSKPPPPLNPHIAPILASGGLDMCVTLTPCAPPGAQPPQRKDIQIGGTISAGKVINPLASSTVSTYEDGVYRRVAYPTGLAPAISVARRAGLVICARESSVSLWRIRKGDKDLDDHDVRSPNGKDDVGYDKLLDMELDTATNICASSVSDDGKWLAVSDAYETKLFALRDVDTVPHPKRIKSFPTLLSRHLPRGSHYPSYHGCGASALTFSPDSSKLIVAAAACGSVLVVDLGPSGSGGAEGDVRVLRRFDHHRSRDAMFGGRVMKAMPNGRGPAGAAQVNGKHGGADVAESSGTSDSDSENDESPSKSHPHSRSPSPVFGTTSSASDAATPLITRFSISADGQWLASTDTHRRTHVFNLDSVAHHAALPSTPQVVNAMAFAVMGMVGSTTNVPNGMDVDGPHHSSSPVLMLILAIANNTLSMYDVESRLFPEWAQHICDGVPPTFKRLYDSVQGVLVDPNMSGARHDAEGKKNSEEDEDAEDGMNVDNEGEERDEDSPNIDAPQTRVPGPSETPKYSNRIMFWGSSWLCSADLGPSSSSSSDASSSLPDEQTSQILPGMNSKKRRLELSSKIEGRKAMQAMRNRDAKNNFGAAFNLYAADETDHAPPEHRRKPHANPTFNFVTRYRPVLFADYLSPGELIIVERPLVDLMASLPPAFFKPKYGT